MTKITYIPGEIANAAIDEHGNRKPVTRTHHIFDDAKDKNQAEINAEVDDTFAFHQSEINALNSQNYVTVDSFSSLPATGATDTVYRVSNWDGSQQDPSVYSEYAWNGEEYKHLSTKTQIGEVFDISAYHATGGTLATYADLSAALDSNGGGVPQSLQKGGMSIKFVQSSDNKYVQYRLMSPSWSTTVDDWQEIVNSITKSNATSLAENTDLNSVTTFGIYSITAEVSSTLSNAPRTSGGGYLIVEKITPANNIFVKQTIIYGGTNTGYKYIRYKFTDWQDWIEVEKQVKVNSDNISYLLSNSIILKSNATSLVADTDLNSVTTFGIYSFTDVIVSTLGHIPDGVSGGGYLIVERTVPANAPFLKQTLILGSNMKSYYRYGTNWTNWICEFSDNNIYCYFAGRTHLYIENTEQSDLKLYFKPTKETSAFNIYGKGAVLLLTYQNWAAFAAALGRTLVTSTKGVTNCIALSQHEYVVYNIGLNSLAIRGNGALLPDDIVMIHNVAGRCIYVKPELYNPVDVLGEMNGIKSELQEQINDIQDEISSGDTSIPTWWQSYMDSKIQTINGKSQSIGVNGDNFVFITDIHSENNFGNSPKLINYILHNTPIRNVVIGGDLLSNATDASDACSKIQALRNKYNFTERVFPVKGNHDLAINESISITEGDYYSIMLRPLENIISLNKLPYYYRDNVSQKIRYIFVDNSVDGALTASEITWLQGKITELENGWSVVIFAHCYWHVARVSNTPTILIRGTALESAIDAVVDNANATVIALIVGHVHRDIDTTSAKGYKIIGSTCDAGGSTASNFDPVTPTRTAETTTEQAFDVYNIDTDAKKIYITRIGGNGSDREFTYQ